MASPCLSQLMYQLYNCSHLTSPAIQPLHTCPSLLLPAMQLLRECPRIIPPATRLIPMYFHVHPSAKQLRRKGYYPYLHAIQFPHANPCTHPPHVHQISLRQRHTFPSSSCWLHRTIAPQSSLLPPTTRLLYTPSPSSARCRTSAHLSHRHPAATQFLHACPLSSAYTASSHLSIPHPLATQLRQACPTLIRSCTATPGAPHLASFTVLSDLPLVLPATASFVRQLHGFLTNLFHV